jgi:transposase
LSRLQWTGYDRSQTLLLPEAVDDYVGPDNPVRFIDAFVDIFSTAAARPSSIRSGPSSSG